MTLKPVIVLAAAAALFLAGCPSLPITTTKDTNPTDVDVAGDADTDADSDTDVDTDVDVDTSDTGTPISSGTGG